jgi:hypothetical protein
MKKKKERKRKKKREIKQVVDEKDIKIKNINLR